MYKYIVILFSILSAVSLIAQDKEIQYRTDFIQAFDQALKERKNVFIYFYVESCDACDYLDDEMYNRSIAKLYNSSFLNYKVDAESTGKKIAEYLGIYTYPTLMYFDQYGDPIYRSKGYKEGEDIFAIGKLARQSNRDINRTMKNKFKENPSDLDHLLEYVEYLSLQGKNKKSEKYLKEYLLQRSEVEEAVWMNAVLDYASDFESFAYEVLVADKEKFIPNYGKKIVDEAIMYSISNHIQGNSYSTKALKFRSTFNEELIKAGYDPYSPEAIVFLSSLFYDQQFASYYDASSIAELKLEYGKRMVKLKETNVPHDLMLSIGVHLVTKSRDTVVLKNLYGRLEKNFQDKPHYDLLDLQSVVLYLLDDKDASVMKIREARDLAIEQNNLKFRPSINQFRKLGIID